MTTTANQVPSVRQMLVRANSGHHAALRAVRDGQPVLGPSASMGDYRGMRTCLSTLRYWECIDGATLTERGRDLLALLDERHERTMARISNR